MMPIPRQLASVTSMACCSCALRGSVAAGPDHFGITVVEKVSSLDQLAQGRVHGGQQAFRCESGHRGRDVMVLDDELPFFRAHDGGDMSRCDQRIKARGARFQQHGHRRPGQTAG